jgi:hypothetical protein
MTKAKKFQYQIQYVDNTYRIVEWTKAEYSEVVDAMAHADRIVAFDEGIFVLSDVRTIVFIPEIEEPEQEKIDEENALTEWGFVDPDVAAWLKSQGIDTSKGGAQ